MGARNSNGELACIVLAAGKGTRMRSARVKVLHSLLGRPLVSYPVNLARELGADPVVAVLGHQREAVEAALTSEFGEGTVRTVEQAEQRGTGHAVRLAMPVLRRFAGIVVILYGDVPLLRRETVRALVGTARRYGCLALVTTSPPDPTGYGRILRDQRGHVIGVVEQKDASEEELAIGEINAGIYAAPADFLRTATAGLSARNAQGEYYLTDIVARAARTIGVSAVDADFRDVAGINDRRQLGESEAIMRARINASWMRHVTFHDAASTVIEPGVTLGVDVELGQGVSLRGSTRVGRAAHIDDGAVLIDTVVGAGAHVAPYTVAFGAEIAAGALVGPLVSLGPAKTIPTSPATKPTVNGARNGAGAATARLKRATRKSAVVRARG
jgi:bifunctional UDP-N-acetylglucosamine pyrophosphorylase/glucosamine-1-phosphate N-acetyltransferase